MGIGVLISGDFSKESGTMKKKDKNIKGSKTKGRPQRRLRKLLDKLRTFQFKQEVTKTRKTEFGFRNTDD